MSAVETLETAQAAGIWLSVDGSELLIEADCAPPPDLLDSLRRDKPEILAMLRAREAGEQIPATTATKSPNMHGLTLAELQKAAGEDWPEVRDDSEVLEALAHAVVTYRQREQGERPPHWSATCECAGCGPVFIWPGSPARVLGCPWCFNRAQDRPIPRPVSVTCGTCRHFLRIDHPHLGHCAKGEPEAIAGLWDTDRRGCTLWLPSEHNRGVQPNGQ